MRKIAMLAASAALASPAFAVGAMTPLERRHGRFLRDPEGHPAGPKKSADEVIAQIKSDLSTATEQVKGIAEEALGKAKAGEALATGVKEQADELLTKMNGLAEKFAELEQAAQRPKDAPAVKSIGARFVEAEKVKELLESQAKRGRVECGIGEEVKAIITSLTTDAAGSAGAALNPTRLPGILPLAQRKLYIQDLISPGQMSGNALEYVKQTGFTNGAGMVAEGGAKPQSDIKLTLVTTAAKVIAHHMKASRQIMDDVPQLRTLIDNNLLFGLAFKKEAQILSGDGTGQNLLGIIPQATAYVAPVGAAAATNLMDVLRLAMLQAVLAEYPATGHVLNPIDWASIEITKDDMGRYLISNPQGEGTPRMWGLPVVESQSMTQGKFLTGAFQLGAQYFDRWNARVELATENEDDFVKNLVTLLAEERGALAVYRPEAFIYGDLVVPGP